MGIRVIPKPKKTLQAGGKRTAAETAGDGYFDRIVKYIPSQVLTFYTAGTTMLTNTATAAAAPGTSQTLDATPTPGAATDGSATMLWLLFAAGVALTVFLTYWQTRDQNNNPSVKHIVISTIAFLVWAYALGGPFAYAGLWKASWGGILLGLVVIVLGTIKPTPSEAPEGGQAGGGGGSGGGGGA